MVWQYGVLTTRRTDCNYTMFILYEHNETLTDIFQPGQLIERVKGSL